MLKRTEAIQRKDPNAPCVIEMKELREGENRSNIQNSRSPSDQQQQHQHHHQQQQQHTPHTPPGTPPSSAKHPIRPGSSHSVIRHYHHQQQQQNSSEKPISRVPRVHILPPKRMNADLERDGISVIDYSDVISIVYNGKE